MEAENFDLERIFRVEGAGIVHISGLFAALSPSTGRLCLEIVRTAKKCGTLVSFDLNHRASFWCGREKELTLLFHDIASMSDLLVGNEEDFQLCLGVEGPRVGGRDIVSGFDSFARMVNVLKERYPGAGLYAATLREVVDANRHLWGAVMLEGNELFSVSPREIEVLDRIGGGDGFVGGLLYGLLKGWEAERRLQFAWSCGVLAVTFTTDFARPVDEQMVWNVWKGNARVQR